MYLVFTPMPGESYRRRLRPLLVYLCYVFQALINSLVYYICVYILYDSEKLMCTLKALIHFDLQVYMIYDQLLETTYYGVTVERLIV